MTAASELAAWHFGFALSVVVAAVALFASRDWRPRSPGDRALDDIEAEL